MPRQITRIPRTCERCGTPFLGLPSEVKRGGARYCSPQCTRPDFPERFWIKVEKGDGPDACWLWTGAGATRSYGRIQMNGKPKGAHVVAWEIENGPVPDGMLVCHTCDVKRCVRNDGASSHLFLGTSADNSADMVAKGRQATGARSGMQLHPESRTTGDDHWTRNRPDLVAAMVEKNWMVVNPERVSGEQNPRAKLTWDDVHEIRRRFAENPYRGFMTDMARRYGVDPVSISYLVHGKTWPDPDHHS